MAGLTQAGFRDPDPAAGAAGRRAFSGETMTDGTEAARLSEMLAPYVRRTERDLARWLVEDGVPGPLAEAMRYCTMGAGKRLRPAVVWMSAEAVHRGRIPREEPVARAAVAVELVHCYSLVHDDLPSMDDDTLRRGRATAHVKFGEAMAILVGDALLTRAFGVLTSPDDPDDGLVAASLAGILAHAAGATGMIAGQVADMALCDLPPGPGGVQYVHQRKTAALVRAAAEMGALCGGAGEREFLAVRTWAELLGLAFQLLDDLLDATGSAEQLGKTPGKDAGAGKRGALAELGQETAEQMSRELTDRAVAALAPLGGSADKLKELTRLLARRTH